MSESINLDYNEIINLIPHRLPFLLIDKVENLIPNLSATGIKSVTATEPHFAGHFPNYPVMPGVLIIEAMAQTAACLISHSNIKLQSQKVVFLTGVETAKFKKIVSPGNVLYLEIKLLNQRKNFFKFTGNAFCDKQLMATANFSAMLSN